MEIKLPDLISQARSLIQGEEKRLRQRQRHARLGIVAALGGLALQLLYLLKLDAEKLGRLLNHLVELDFQALKQDGHLIPELTAFIFVFGGLAIYMLLRWTGFLLRESREPFRYTFHIEDFARVADTPPAARFVLENEDRFKLLSHDLIERLNQRIKRLSGLEGDTSKNKEVAEHLGSHIAVKGHYAIREQYTGHWIIEVMPRVRIGPEESPWTWAPPVKYPLIPEAVKPKKEKPEEDAKPALKSALDADMYNQIVERVYSAVATEVYRQIETDVRNKITMFPTAYRRAVALGHEAEDFARSNTVDAYDRAIALYRQALRYFAIANVQPITAFMIRWPLLWRKEMHFVHTRARVIIGYAKALIYRRKLSALTGQYLNPLFEIPPLIEDVIANLRMIHWHVTGLDIRGRQNANRAYLTFPEDTWARYVELYPSRELFDRQRHVLFDALVAAALAYFYLDAVHIARQYLEDARAVDPQRSQQDALFLMTEAEIEPALHKEIILFQKAAEVAPDFQIANYLYAYHSEMLFRARDELTPERAARVIDLYEEVLQRINPGNITALAAQGYLHWLLKKNDECKRKFEQGRELKSIIRETFVGVLNYGLARVAAEEGRFNECYDRYTEAVAADPGVAAYSTDARGRTNGAYYEYVTADILTRYRDYCSDVQTLLQLDPTSGKAKGCESCSERTRQTVLSFVLNDYATARFNYYMRTGDEAELNGALATYQEAVTADPTNATAYYNLASAQMIKGTDQDAQVANFAKAEARAPTWPTVLTATAKAAMEAITRIIAAKEKERSDAEARHADELQHVNQVRRSRERRAREEARENALTEPDERQAAEPPAAVLEQLEKEHKERLASINDAIAQQRARIDTDVTGRLAEAFARTRFGPLLAGSGAAEEPVNRLLSMQIERSRIDENDIDTLRLLAAVLAKNIERARAAGETGETDKIRSAAERLCQFLSEYYPEDFDRDLLMYNMYVAAGNKVAAAQRAAQLKAQIVRWLDMDPGSYLAFTWLPDARPGFTLREVDERVRAAIEFAPENTATYRVIAGDAYFVAEHFQEAIREYSAAVMPVPKSADHANRLANTYYRTGDYEHAREFYEAAIRLSPNWDLLYSNLGGALRQLKQWPEAVAAYTKARELAPKNDSHRLGLRNAYNEWGNQLSYADKEKEAIEQYAAAIALDPDDAVIRSNLSSSLEALREPGKEQAYLDQAIAQLEKATELSRDTTEYRRRLDNLKLTRRVVSRCGPQVLDRYPIVTPIAVDLASNLAPYVAGSKGDELAPLANQLTTEMRERVHKETGVRVPGVRYRDSDLSDGTYVISLNEVPLISGNVNLTHRLCTASRALLDTLKIEAEPGTRPDTETDAFWISKPDWATLQAAGGELWEPIEYPIRHLERLVRRNLALYLGYQEVTNLLRENDGPAAKAILQDGAGVSGLTVTLRALVSEEVPIVALTAILDRFLELWKEDATLQHMVAQLRLLPQLRPHLPGAGTQTSLHRLGDRLEQRIEQAVARDNGRFVLALDPVDCQAMLSAVREHVRERPRALVVRETTLRPFVRKLVELEFPDLSVLAAEELQADVLPAGLPIVELDE